MEGERAAWLDCRGARLFYANIRTAGGRVNADRVPWAIEKFCATYSPALRRSEVVAFVPRKMWKAVRSQLRLMQRSGRLNVAGMQICATDDLNRHVVVFAIADVELGHTPAPAKYVIYTTNPKKRVRHHIILKRRTA